MALTPLQGRSGNRPACDPTERVFRGRDAACREGAVRPAGRKPFDPPSRRDCSRRARRPRYQWARGRVPRSPAAGSVQQVAWAVGHSFPGGSSRYQEDPEGFPKPTGSAHCEGLPARWEPRARTRGTDGAYWTTTCPWGASNSGRSGCWSQAGSRAAMLIWSGVPLAEPPLSRTRTTTGQPVTSRSP
jgi:hypothetical protein